MIIGVDEAGRGAWAGPLYVAAVSFNGNDLISGLNDSKKLSPKTRENIRTQIMQFCKFSLAKVSSEEIDEYGLTHATKLAIVRALKKFDTKKINKIVIDGNTNFLKNTKYEKFVVCLVKADSQIPEVMAASILAKTERDKYMKRLSRLYPEYEFDRHFGYGTQMHRTILELKGACPLHRQSYAPIKGLL